MSVLSGFLLQKIYDHSIRTNETVHYNYMGVHIKLVSIEWDSTVQTSVNFRNFAELRWNTAIAKTTL